MARRGDGIYARGGTWYLDFQHHGARYQVRLGKGIRRSVAKDLATAKRGEAPTHKARAVEMMATPESPTLALQRHEPPAASAQTA
jgi:hypothetical protein